jgi:glucose-6-phosphate dehydrogenase assembly protein OpcA
VADRIVVDSRAVAGAGTAPGGETHAVLPSIAALARRLPVADLSWTRLAPWRSLLAGLFEGSQYRPFLQEIERVEVVGNYGPRHLLGGWLLRRLSVNTARVSLSPADHVSIRISAMHRHRTGLFTVERPSNARVIQSSVEIDGGPSVSQTVRMRQRWPALALAGALTRMGRDDVYCQALEGALELRNAGAAGA